MSDIPANELKAAVESMNKSLGKSDRIKLLKRKREDVLTELTDKIQGFIEEGNEGDLPNDVIAFYNKYIASDEEEEEELDDEVEETEEDEENDGEEADDLTPPAKKSTKGGKKTSKSVPSKKGGKPSTSGKKTSKPVPPKKTSKPASEKGTKKRGSVSNEQLAFNLVSEGKSEKEIAKVFTDMYKDKGITDADFIKKRINIYVGIANRKLKK